MAERGLRRLAATSVRGERHSPGEPTLMGSQRIIWPLINFAQAFPGRRVRRCRCCGDDLADPTTSDAGRLRDHGLSEARMNGGGHCAIKQTLDLASKSPKLMKPCGGRKDVREGVLLDFVLAHGSNVSALTLYRQCLTGKGGDRG